MAQLKAKLSRLTRFDARHITRDELTIVLTEVQRCLAAAAAATVAAATATRLAAAAAQELDERTRTAPAYLTHGQLAAVLQGCLQALIRASDELRLQGPARQAFFGTAAAAVRSLTQPVPE